MHARVFPSLLSLALLVVTVRGAETFDEAMARATVEYGARLRQASDELTQVRERIAREKAPLLKAMRAAEDRIIAADSAITRPSRSTVTVSQTANISSSIWLI